MKLDLKNFKNLRISLVREKGFNEALGDLPFVVMGNKDIKDVVSLKGEDMRIVESAVTSRWVEFRVRQSEIDGKGVTVQESEDALELAVGRMHDGFVKLINECVREVRNEKKEES